MQKGRKLGETWAVASLCLECQRSEVKLTARRGWYEKLEARDGRWHSANFHLGRYLSMPPGRHILRPELDLWLDVSQSHDPLPRYAPRIALNGSHIARCLSVLTNMRQLTTRAATVTMVAGLRCLVWVQE